MRVVRRVLQHPRYYAQRLGLGIYKRNLVFFETHIDESDFPSEASQVEYRLLDRNFVEAHQAIGWLSRWESLQQLGRPGFFLCGAILEGRLVGNCWIELTTSDLSYFDLKVPLPAAVAYISRVFVHKEVRGKKIAEHLLHFALAESRRHGKTHAKICCVPGNTAMRHILLKTGWRFEQSVSYLRAIALRVYKFDGGERSSGNWTLNSRSAGQRIFRISPD